MAFQSTRPRGARPQCSPSMTRGVNVSIHAPARGATQRTIEPECRGAVSIHAPARGATPSRRPPNSRSKACSFNPRAREGRDKNRISPASGSCRFQSTRPRGARQDIFEPLRITLSGFNPRAREGRDLASPSVFECLPRCFNPRAREGRDRKTACLLSARWVSIHAPARGATRSRGTSRPSPAFQSTRPRGARPACRRASGGFRKFQSTRPRGARPVAG